MSGRNEQRKLGTTRGSPRRSRTAKASRISRHAVKSRCAREWGGWGRLSDDGPGQNNPDPSEGPWGGGVVAHHGGALSSPRPDAVRDNRRDHEVHEGRTQTGCQTAHAGSRLKPLIAPGRHRLESQPSSRTGENSPYGMIGGIEETSASFEARSAPRSYPTAGGACNETHVPIATHDNRAHRLLRRMSPVPARMRGAGIARSRPLSRQYRKTFVRPQSDAIADGALTRTRNPRHAARRGSRT